ncbi:50S ribosomal protein L11 methyltransferase [candidate division KSB1 bacterium]
MSKQFRSWRVVTVQVHDRSRDAITNFCFECGSTGTEQHDSSVVAYFDASRDLENITGALDRYIESLADLKIITTRPDISVRSLSEESWAENWKQHFPPVRTGRRLLIVPPWDDSMKERGRATIVIEPGMAFGTGFHESTEIALVLLERHLDPGMNVLDIGTGTGILAIAAVKLGAYSVFAVDPEPDAESSFMSNTHRNKTALKSSFRRTGIETLCSGEYDLLTANLKRTLLCEHAGTIADLLRKNGTAIISGFEAADENHMYSKFESCGFSIKEREQLSTWAGTAFIKK